MLMQDAEDQDIDRTMWGELESESEEESEDGRCLQLFPYGI